MTGLATFGELLDVARGYLEQAAAIPGRPPDVGRDLPDIRSGLYALVTEIGRCLPDDSHGNGLVLLENDRFILAVASRVRAGEAVGGQGSPSARARAGECAAPIDASH